MKRLWQVVGGIALGTVCLTIAETQTVTDGRFPGEVMRYTIAAQLTPWGNTLTFIGWFLIVVAGINLIKFFTGK
jgi:hypothetical protein